MSVTWDEVKCGVERAVDALAVQVIGWPEAAPSPEWMQSTGSLLIAISAEATAIQRHELASLAKELAERSSREADNLLPEIERAIETIREDLRMPPAEPPPASIAEDPELLNDFVMEAREHLASIEENLLVLEREPRQTDAIHSVFRSFHTIKGLAGFLNLVEMQEVSHEVETVLDLARNDQLQITPSVIDVVLAAADHLKHWLEVVAGRLSGQAVDVPASAGALLLRVRALQLAGTEIVLEPVESQASAEALEPVPEEQAGGSDKDAKAKSAVKSEANAVRVETSKLDYLVDMVGEMMIAQSLVRHDPDLKGLTRPRLARNLSQLARITQELQKTAMSMRMTHIGSLFQKMARLVRDLSRKSGKRVRFETRGEETELDRHLVEELADPLMHMIRNSLDHGIETPAERKRAGKQEAGRLRLSACHQAGQIIIEVADDGRGLDRDRIRCKAVERGLISEGDSLTDNEVHNLIFQPGFSTAEQVTDISGRGVGMDVVRKKVARLRGRIDIQSTPGGGTVFSLRLPLTLAIIDGLVVGVGTERYIIPLFGVREMIRPTADMISTVENRAEMAMVRGHLLPVVRLSERFGVKERKKKAGAMDENGLLIVAEASERTFCLRVDELIGKQEVVIKSLGEMLNNIPGIAGGAILGDGRVGLILDLDGVFRRKASGRRVKG